MPPIRVWGPPFASLRLNWVLRGAYSYYYQPPPLDTVSGPLLQYAASQGVTFLPLQGERDIQQEYGLTIPVRNWVSSITYFRTGVKNFFDHDVLGNSNIFLPLTSRLGSHPRASKSPCVRLWFSATIALTSCTRTSRRRASVA